MAASSSILVSIYLGWFRSCLPPPIKYSYKMINKLIPFFLFFHDGLIVQFLAHLWRSPLATVNTAMAHTPHTFVVKCSEQKALTSYQHLTASTSLLMFTIDFSYQ